MLVNLRGIEREVSVKKERGTWVCRVGKAKVYWNSKYDEPYVLINGVSYDEVKKHKPLIIEFLKEYKRLVTLPKEVPAMAYEGEGQTNTAYKYQPIIADKDYVSSVPKWIREIKIKQVCSGPKRTFVRGIRVPQEYKQIVEQYMPYCCNCCHRVECDAACLTPVENSAEEMLDGLE